MTKPKAARKTDVTSKLAYANHRLQELMNELFEAKKSERDPAHLVHAASEVIATSRECFDYLGQDIVDNFVIPFTSSAKIKNDYATGSLRAYFPFHESQVKYPGKLFNEVKHGNQQLHADLVAFTEAITKKASIPDTLFEYAAFLEMKDMVNEKKHDKLVAVVSEQDQEHLIENESFKIILPIKGQVGWSSFSVSPGNSAKKVPEYRFAYNDKEASKFCLFALKATERVIGKFYADHFA